MAIRPIDIARRFKISTTTLRHYEDFGMIPDVKRSPNGYRIYTAEHIAYFLCIREMMCGFTLSEIAKILKPVLAKKVDEALWMANKAQAALHKDKYVCDQIKQRFVFKKNIAAPNEYSIDAVSKATGIIPSTIRYWDKIGLISAGRCAVNNYRTFTQAHIDEILMIQALKLSIRARGEKYTVEQIHKELHKLDFEDTEKISAIVAGIEIHLTALNKAQIRSISALYNLCNQVEQNQYDIG
ncbi:MerR family transcriptional regulator [Anaerocolumna sedimenticola]|uniref:MerR family transcriptional regulator n=1 Tax=Anaerocolumna sedimenticola TaxID=2696063 RepID=A0A6P1TTP8_9FIRM|nr:MerR family transcriptional regulator [Anaerocolumna sedimenticola]QHQ63331.1 MerR family transcriptional regulator [Anaerocolumna sedimenticola]